MGLNHACVNVSVNIAYILIYLACSQRCTKNKITDKITFQALQLFRTTTSLSFCEFPYPYGHLSNDYPMAIQ